MSEYEPGVYTKGDNVRLANTPAEAVAYTFDGYARQGAVPGEDGPEYRELQRQAKEAGIPANQSHQALLKALTHPDA